MNDKKERNYTINYHFKDTELDLKRILEENFIKFLISLNIKKEL